MPMVDEIALFAERLDAIGVQHMITGATAAIIYGQPRLTNDLDVVVELHDEHVPALLAAFPDHVFYVPPESVIRVEQARAQRGHFNILHLESGFKCDVYLAGRDALHAWALPRRRFMGWTAGLTLAVAPPEYVILRKLEYFREGGSSKHPADIRAILATTAVDRTELGTWIARLGLTQLWSDSGYASP